MKKVSLKLATGFLALTMTLTACEGDLARLMQMDWGRCSQMCLEHLAANPDVLLEMLGEVRHVERCRSIPSGTEYYDPGVGRVREC